MKCILTHSNQTPLYIGIFGCPGQSFTKQMVTRAQLLASLLRGPEKIYIIAISSLKLRGLRDFPICGRLLVFAGVLRVFAGVLRVILVVFFSNTSSSGDGPSWSSEKMLISNFMASNYASSVSSHTSLMPKGSGFFTWEWQCEGRTCSSHIMPNGVSPFNGDLFH